MSCGTWGSFDQFARLIPNAIRFAGGPNLLDYRPADTANNEDTDSDFTFVAGLQALCLAKGQTRGMTTEEIGAELFDRQPIDACTEFRDALKVATKTPTGRPSADRIGRALGKRKGKPVRVAGKLLKIVRNDDDHMRRLWLAWEIK